MRILLPLLLLAPLTAQAAAVTPFGAGCTFANQTLAIGTSALPQLGSTFAITYTGPNQNQQLTVQPALALGFTATSLPIPATLLPQQPANCTQWIDAAVIQFMPPSGTGPFVDQVAVTVPNTPGLIGFQFTAQWLAVAVQCSFVPPCFLAAIPTSDALLLTVGL